MIDMATAVQEEQESLIKVKRLLKILADENRLKIIRCLASGEKCVCQLTEAVTIPQNLMSHHLKVLKMQGLVEDKRRGRWIYYKLKDKRLTELLQLAISFCYCQSQACQ